MSPMLKTAKNPSVKIKHRLPLFGQIEITLHKESKDLYNILKEKKEIERLKNIEHLGVLHEAFDSPIYTRWTYIVMILYLIERSKGFTNIKISNEVILDKGVRFSSAEELLKCWALLLFIGHLPGTFSAERALLKELKNDNYKLIFNQLFEDEKVRKELVSIVEKEDVFHMYYVLSMYKTIKIMGELEKKEADTDYYRKFYEAFKAFLLRGNYYDKERSITPEKREKLARLINYFKAFRNMSYIILDSYYAQVSLHLNPLYILENLDEMIDDGHLKTLITDIQKYFYRTIYHSPEGITYYLYYARRFSELFDEIAVDGGMKQLIESLCDNELDENIWEVMRRDGGAYEHILRVTFDKNEVDYPLTREEDFLKKCGLDKNTDIIFGFTYNPPTNEYYGDICCADWRNNLHKCVPLLATLFTLFKNNWMWELILLKGYDKNNSFMIDKKIDLIDSERLCSSKNERIYFTGKIKEILSKISRRELEVIYGKKELPTRVLMERILQLLNEKIYQKEVSLEFLAKSSTGLKVFFAKGSEELDQVRELLKGYANRISDQEKKNELNSLINQLNNEKYDGKRDNYYYIITTGIRWIPSKGIKNDKDNIASSSNEIEGEIDGMYIKLPINLEGKWKIVIIEAKKSGSPQKEQIKRIRWLVGKAKVCRRSGKILKKEYCRYYNFKFVFSPK